MYGNKSAIILFNIHLDVCDCVVEAETHSLYCCSAINNQMITSVCRYFFLTIAQNSRTPAAACRAVSCLVIESCFEVFEAELQFAR
jgi:hypothetical protein